MAPMNTDLTSESFRATRREEASAIRVIREIRG
jgi:hypothetical protein